MTQGLMIWPLLVPLLSALALLLETRQRRNVRRATGLLATASLLPMAILLWLQTSSGEILVYPLGNWPPPFGIVLVLDSLSALMLLLTALLALPVYLHALQGDDQRGVNFHALFQFQLFGINGAFLTGDLFNLFVFFEVLLIASYALLMHGQGAARAVAGLHYVILNLVGSSLFLFALGLIYAATGTLNMADVGAALQRGDVPGPALLLQVGAALLLVVFGLKAALLPFSFWLPGAYAAAAAPVAALFAIMTKVGLYAIWRLWPLMYGVPGPLHGQAAPWLFGLALATLVLAALGALAATRLAQLCAWLVLVSVGTLMAVLTTAEVDAWAAGLYYLLHSTFATAALFLLAGLISASRGDSADQLCAGPALPARSGQLFLLLAILLIGLPPLSGFIGKLLILQSLPSPALWLAMLGASLITLITLSRAGSTLFWRHLPVASRPLTLLQTLPTLVLITLCLAMTVAAAPLLEQLSRTAAELLDGSRYINAVLGTPGETP